MPVVEPCSVSVFIPAPVAVTLPEKSNAPLPDWSSTPPPVVPARLMMRSVACAPPVTTKMPVAPRLPRSMVPLALVAGAPSDENNVPPLTRFNVVTLKPPL